MRPVSTRVVPYPTASSHHQLAALLTDLGPRLAGYTQDAAIYLVLATFWALVLYTALNAL